MLNLLLNFILSPLVVETNDAYSSHEIHEIHVNYFDAAKDILAIHGD